MKTEDKSESVEKKEVKAESEFFQVGLQNDVVNQFFKTIKPELNTFIEMQEFKNSDCRLTILVANNRAKAFVIERRTDFNDLDFIKGIVNPTPKE